MIKIKLNNIKMLRIVFILFFLLATNTGLKAHSTLYTKDCIKDRKEHFVKVVCDGDTISFTNCKKNQKHSEKKIRLIGIDAFELEQKPYGKQGKDFLKKLILNKKVCIETDVEEKDKYGRTLGYIFLDRKLINEEMVKNGFAILYNFPPNTKYISRLKKAQVYGRKNKLGVWKEGEYIKETPSQFRRKKKK